MVSLSECLAILLKSVIPFEHLKTFVKKSQTSLVIILGLSFVGRCSNLFWHGLKCISFVGSVPVTGILSKIPSLVICR